MNIGNFREAGLAALEKFGAYGKLYMERAEMDAYSAVWLNGDDLYITIIAITDGGDYSVDIQAFERTRFPK